MAAGAPALGVVRGDASVDDGLEPVVEQRVGERVPDLERLAHRLDALVRLASAQRRGGLARRPAPHHVGRRRVGLGGRGEEAQALGLGRELLGQTQRGCELALSRQPGDRQQRRLLGQADAVGTGGHARLELGEALVAERASEGLLAARRLPWLERPARGRLARREAAPQDLGRDPRGHVLDRGPRTDPQHTARHPAQHRGPLVRPLGRGGLGQLRQHVSAVDLHTSVAGAAPAPSGVRARCSAVELHAVERPAYGLSPCAVPGRAVRVRSGSNRRRPGRARASSYLV